MLKIHTLHWSLLPVSLYWRLAFMKVCKEFGRLGDRQIRFCLTLPWRDTASSWSQCELIAKDFWNVFSLFKVLKPLSIVCLTSIVKKVRRRNVKKTRAQESRLRDWRWHACYLSVLDESLFCLYASIYLTETYKEYVDILEFCWMAFRLFALHVCFFSFPIFPLVFQRRHRI